MFTTWMDQQPSSVTMQTWLFRAIYAFKTWQKNCLLSMNQKPCLQEVPEWTFVAKKITAGTWPLTEKVVHFLIPKSNELSMASKRIARLFLTLVSYLFTKRTPAHLGLDPYACA